MTLIEEQGPAYVSLARLMRRESTAEQLQEELRISAVARATEMTEHKTAREATEEELVELPQRIAHTESAIVEIENKKAHDRSEQISMIVEAAKTGIAFTFPNAEVIAFADIQITLLKDAREAMRDRMHELKNDILLRQRIKENRSLADAFDASAERETFNQLVAMVPVIEANGVLEINLNSGKIGGLRQAAIQARERAASDWRTLDENRRYRQTQELQRRG